MKKFLLGLMLSALSCSVKVDPDVGRYSCELNRDCGADYECRPQAKGASRCYKIGQCKETDVCDGADEDCNGVIDDKYAEADAGCTAMAAGPCSAGNTVCETGALVCQQRIFPGLETCNGIDDNCNGMVDESFDFTTDELHCGSCANSCASGAVCLNSICKESACDDGLDNDNNGKSDCNDDICFQQVCNSNVAPNRNCGQVMFREDAGVSDAGIIDAGPIDAGPDDAGFESDAGIQDAGDIDAGFIDAGLDAGVIDAGRPDAGLRDAGFIIGCFPPESDCADGFDNDGDFNVDCADTNCNSLTCAPAKTCGNGICR